MRANYISKFQYLYGIININLTDLYEIKLIDVKVLVFIFYFFAKKSY